MSFTEHLMSTAATGTAFAIAAEVDVDGDSDGLSTSGGDNKLASYKRGGGSLAKALESK